MSLSAKLDALRAGAADRLPAGTLAIMHQATANLRTTNMLSQVINVGETMPDFELPDSHGEMVASAALLAEGPLVVSFYRGLW